VWASPRSTSTNVFKSLISNVQPGFIYNFVPYNNRNDVFYEKYMPIKTSFHSIVLCVALFTLLVLFWTRTPHLSIPQMIDYTRWITVYLSLWFSCPRFSRVYHARWRVRHLLPKWRLLPKCVIAHVSWRGLHLLPNGGQRVLIKIADTILAEWFIWYYLSYVPVPPISSNCYLPKSGRHLASLDQVISSSEARSEKSLGTRLSLSLF
jgi:hypothetical protein